MTWDSLAARLPEQAELPRLGLQRSVAFPRFSSITTTLLRFGQFLAGNRFAKGKAARLSRAWAGRHEEVLKVPFLRSVVVILGSRKNSHAPVGKRQKWLLPNLYPRPQPRSAARCSPPAGDCHGASRGVPRWPSIMGDRTPGLLSGLEAIALLQVVASLRYEPSSYCPSVVRALESWLRQRR